MLRYFRRYRKNLKLICGILLLLVVFIFFINTLSNVKSLGSLSEGSAELIFKNPYLRFDDSDKVDYHDYHQMNLDELRVGPGEQGQPVIIDPSEEKLRTELWEANGFNALVSDKMALNRSLKDIRHPDCRKRRYLPNLPSVSIIVPFFQEHFSVLIRTVVSTTLRAPKGVIKEVILSDDGSEKPFLKEELEKYLATHFDNVKVFRETKREGLIRNRLNAAKIATGDVLIFLDSHCEALVNWLPPLLEPIMEDYRTVTCPFIDVIDMKTFEYRAQDEGMRGVFEWETFFYKRIPRLKSDELHPTDPFESPVMAGGLFAISRKWFWELEGYDPGLEIWGGEQYELSFKLWQCGGRMVDVPCSRIGHIYRAFSPHGSSPIPTNFFMRNHKRVAAVWMDDYQKYLFAGATSFQEVDPLDISKQKALRERLKCKNFEWFLKNVASDMLEYYPYIPPPNVAEGELRNFGTNLCVDTAFGAAKSVIKLNYCSGGKTGEQLMALSQKNELKVKGKKLLCFDSQGRVDEASEVLLWDCHGAGGNQYWKYNHIDKQLITNNGYCLQSNALTKSLSVNKCDVKSEKQMWTWTTINMTLLLSPPSLGQPLINSNFPLVSVFCVCTIFLSFQIY